MAIQERLMDMLEERNIPRYKVEDTSYPWMIRYIFKGEERFISPDTRVEAMNWMDEDVLDPAEYRGCDYGDD